ncbi:MAG: DUF481 domain-containing protein [Bdellovibrio sp.]|nr:DUF481 domain-containing protein [Bdellovibrio sp.]
MKLFFAVVFLFLGFKVSAEESAWVHESELSIVSSGGNTKSDTFSAKQKTSYTLHDSKVTAAASYLQGKSSQTDKTSGVSTEVKNLRWDASLRYDYAFNEKFGAFFGHGAESDSDAGYVQRDNTDLGGQYTVIKSDEQSLITEAGLRYTKTYDGTLNDYATYGRLYAEYVRHFTKTINFKLWAEHLPNLKESQNYLSNAEASVSVILTSTFSLKTAYLAKYHNRQVSTAVVEDKRLETLLTTALVAAF